MSDQEPNKPEAEFPVGGTVKTAVWRNETGEGDDKREYYTTQLQRRYYDKTTRTFKTSSSLPTNDIPRAILALQKAYDHIMTRPRGAATKEAGATENTAESEDVPI